MARSQLSRRFFLGGGVGLVALASCDLIEFAQNPVVRFKLPPRTYVLSTDDPNWKQPPAFFNKAIACTDKASCCPPPGVPAELVAGQCNSVPIVCQSSLCGIEFPLETFHTIDLAKDAPSLAGSNSKVVSEITLESLEYKITNGVGVDFPAVKLYLAPMGTTTASGQGVQFISESPRAPRGVVTQELRTMSEEARTVFASYAKNLDKPFNFIAAANVAVLSGTDVRPGQKVEIEVTGTIQAKL